MLRCIAGNGREDGKVMDKIFHQAVRYAYARRAVNILRTKDTHTILEVGAGAHARLAEYLPDDDIIFLDADLPEEVCKDARFAIGDATDLAYGTGSFDFVIALDVIEHIPKQKRAAFISNIHRVAKQGVVLSAPYYSEQNPYDDRMLKIFYYLYGSKPPKWIDEHVTCTLPTEEEIRNLIAAQGARPEQIACFYGEKRQLMQKMMIMEAAASRYGYFEDLFEIINSEYIHSILDADFGLPKEEAMKLYVVWTKDVPVAAVEKYFCGDGSHKHVLARFEKKYTKLMEWAMGLVNVAVMEKLQEQCVSLCQMQLAQDAATASWREGSAKVLQQLQEQNAIAAQWRAESAETYHELLACLRKQDKIRLNVILITYNHEMFIRETLETVLMQETNFRFNIFIADDCSVDGTVSIIREMEQGTDIPFVYLANHKNLGIMQNYKRAFAACDAEYVAIMEGDDLWTDKYRLQKHVDFLDSHCECAMTFNQFLVKNFEKGTIALQPRFTQEEEKKYFRYITGHDLAYSNLIGNFSTCVYRSSALKALPEQMYALDCYDWLTNIMVSKTGYIGCLIQPMSIYRIHDKGVWSGRSDKEKNEALIKSIDAYDKFTNGEFREGFAAHKARLSNQTIFVPVQGKNAAKAVVKRMLKKCYQISAYLPPFFLCLVKLIVPEKMKNKIARNL